MSTSSQTFELNLFDTTRSGQLTALLLLGSFGLLGVSFWAITKIDNVAVLLLTVAVVLGGGGYLGWRAYKQAAIAPAIITISPAELRIEDQRPEPRLSQTLRLADITTYRYSSYNGTEELRLNQAAAPPLKLRGTGNLVKTGDFSAMLAAFEQAMGAAPNPSSVATRREKSFFEKPISTYVLIAFTLLLGGLGFMVFTSGKGIHGNMFGILGSYIAYITAWRAAAERRNAA